MVETEGKLTDTFDPEARKPVITLVIVPLTLSSTPPGVPPNGIGVIGGSPVSASMYSTLNVNVVLEAFLFALIFSN